MKNYQVLTRKYRDLFDLSLNKYFEFLKDAPELLISSMKYSLLAGGKRLRPVLFLAFLDILGEDIQEFADFSVIFELIHTYSLIHDDLPAMDNDDFRRGKLTNHKVYGEGMAVLAGDALLNSAYEYGLFLAEKNNALIKPLTFVAKCAGQSGMIGGQVQDINAENLEVTEKNLKYIQLNKTAKMFIAPIFSAALVSEKSNKKAFYDFAENLGYLFQVTDDILDAVGSEEKLGKKVGKDKSENKLTAIAVYGLDGAKKMAENYYEKCMNCLNFIDNSDYLKEFVKSVLNREK